MVISLDTDVRAGPGRVAKYIVQKRKMLENPALANGNASGHSCEIGNASILEVLLHIDTNIILPISLEFSVFRISSF